MFFRLGKGIYIFHLKEKPPPEKFIKIKFNQMAQITSAKTKLIFFKSNKKMSEMRIGFKHPKNCDMQREFHI